MLVECVECGKELSKSADTCSNCHSSDPFEIKKRKERYSRIFGAIIFTIGLAGFIYYVNEFGLLNYIR